MTRRRASWHYFPPRRLIPCASVLTLNTEPPPTTYSVFMSGPAKVRFCGLREKGILPSNFPCGLKTCTEPPAAA